GAGAGGAPECVADVDCAGSTEGHVCDPSTQTCVECLKKADCHPGEYCAAAAKTCTPGCETASDCNLNGGTLTCDAMTHTCLGCSTDDECPPGLLCDPGSMACVAGCTDAHGCQTGRECCSGECANLLTDEAHCGLCGTACNAPGTVPK